MTASTLTITRPDDWHVHLRDEALLRSVVGATARVFGRAVVMPNLDPPITTVAAAAAYRERIAVATPPDSRFAPLLTLYLTDNTPAEEIVAARKSGFVIGAKYYPAGATTTSDSGVTAHDRVYPALEAMEKHGLPLLIHGEATASEVDVFDRERVFVEGSLARIVRDFPALKVVLEHVTTHEGAEFVAAAPAHVGATITPQHLSYSRNALFAGGIRPHRYCLPVLKRESHRQALIQAATGGNPKFFLGTDSAPHLRRAKESACGCAGCYTAHAALELYAEAFEAAGALERLEAFASFHGPDFYGLPRNTDTVTLAHETWTVPDEYAAADEVIVPFNAGATMRWRLVV
ncbi:MAG: dihydroorotase [Betaproteobacteria bacterium]|nr:MAG: dihydroorotase [Betaproteobacteria bacterium]